MLQGTSATREMMRKKAAILRALAWLRVDDNKAYHPRLGACKGQTAAENRELTSGMPIIDVT